MVIHSAASVSFDDPITESFEANIGGVVNLYESLRASGGDPRVVHVSTCYVQGLRKGVAPEARLTHNVDWRAEYEFAFATRDRIEAESREPERLRAFMEAAQAEQVRSIAVERLGAVLGQAPADVMADLDDALRLHLQL